MKEALWHLLDDFFSALLFLLAYIISGRLDVAIGAVVLFAVLPALRLVLARRRLGRLRWLGLGLVLALAGAAWLTRSPRFIMARPCVVHFVLAAAMLRCGWLRPYLNSDARRLVPERLVVAAGYGWAALMAALGCVNLVVALYFDLRVWSWLVAVISPSAKLAPIALQFAVFRTIRRRLGSAALGEVGLHPAGSADISPGTRGGEWRRGARARIDHAP